MGLHRFPTSRCGSGCATNPVDSARAVGPDRGPMRGCRSAGRGASCRPVFLLLLLAAAVAAGCSLNTAGLNGVADGGAFPQQDGGPGAASDDLPLDTGPAGSGGGVAAGGHTGGGSGGVAGTAGHSGQGGHPVTATGG